MSIEELVDINMFLWVLLCLQIPIYCYCGRPKHIYMYVCVCASLLSACACAFLVQACPRKATCKPDAMRSCAIMAWHGTAWHSIQRAS